eukprot:c19720_g2_i6.p1 GENE.c19720_g2_i6~~c19720_g2_i6.p1  ORF type:complete len:648 (+),score=174.06 c19720_g2_i6:737-2680(+)
MNVGEGRVGKSALYEAMLRNTFQPNGIPSTVGIDAMTYQVTGVACGSLTWTEVDLKMRRELEYAVAMLTFQLSRPEASAAERGWLESSLSQKRNEMLAFLQQQAQDMSTRPPAEQQPNRNEHRNRRVEDKQSESDPVEASVQTSGQRAPDSARDLRQQECGEVEVVQRFNQDLVLQYYNDLTAHVDWLIFSAWDYGGQEVFYSLHALFMTRYGVYLVVFNLEDLAESAPESVKARCLRFLRFWLFSVVMHALGPDGSTPPVHIVGTHKDKVFDRREHERISTLIHDTFAASLVWQSVQPCRDGVDQNQRVLLWFLPVDNTRGHRDPIIKALMSSIESVARKEEYINKKVPFEWLQLMDKVEQLKEEHPVMSFAEVRRLAVSCGLPTSGASLDEETLFALTYLNELAILMWYDELALRDLVILDPNWLIKAATKIVCKFDIHFISEHEAARKMYKAWKLLSSEATVTGAMRDVLWRDYSASTRQALIHLMAKYGLAVQLRDGCYLIPDLLKPRLDEAQVLGGGSVSLACLFVFRVTASSFGDSSELPVSCPVMTLSELKEGFLPTGMFVRLLAKSVTWCQSTTGQGSFQPRLSKTQAVLVFGGDMFMIEEDQSTNSIRVFFGSNNPALVLERLQDLANEVLSECFTNL